MIPTIASWLPYLRQQVGHAPFTGQDTFGEATFGTVTWYPAWIEQEMVRGGGVGGGINVVTARLHIIIGAAVVIDPRDRLLVPSPFTTRSATGVFSTGEDAQMTQMSPTMGPVFGQHHTEVWTE